MKNSIVENYYLQLINLYAKAPSEREKSIIKEAATQLLDCSSLLDIFQLFGSYSDL